MSGFSIRELLHTQNIHATFELQGLFDDILWLLGNVSHQTLHHSGIDILNNHFYLLCDCLDLNTEMETDNMKCSKSTNQVFLICT